MSGHSHTPSHIWAMITLLGLLLNAMNGWWMIRRNILGIEIIEIGEGEGDSESCGVGGAYGWYGFQLILTSTAFFLGLLDSKGSRP